jgi:hypothetical protein
METTQSYYEKNRDKIININKNYYKMKIKSMSASELISYRKERSEYYKKWYYTNRKKKRKIDTEHKRKIDTEHKKKFI